MPSSVVLTPPERPGVADAREHMDGGRAAVVSVAGAVVAALVLRLPLVGLPAFPDEAGYLLVSRYWHSGGPGLYGDLWVDRPPLLILFWRLANHLGGIEAGRWLALVAVGSLVVAAGSAGWSISGLSGARWAAIAAAAFSVSPLLDAAEVDGELLAAPLVMTACALALLARRHGAGRRTAAYAMLAGVTAACAILVKQNFIEGPVFIGVLLAFSGWRGDMTRREVGRILRWSSLGLAIPLAVTIWWAVTESAGLDALTYALFGFRSAAGAAIASQNRSAPDQRLDELTELVIVSGMLPLALYFLGRAAPAVRRRDPLAMAVGCMFLIEGAGIALGGSYWSHYLLGMIPSTCLGVAWLTTRPRPDAQILVTLAAAANLVAAGVFIATPHSGGVDTAVADYLSRAHARGDTGYVAYGHPDILESSGLKPAYSQMWSLPLRVLDPHLAALTRRLRSAGAPTWFVQGGPVDSWHLDDHQQLEQARDAHYHWVADVCGVPIYLLNGVSRADPAVGQPCA